MLLINNISFHMKINVSEVDLGLRKKLSQAKIGCSYHHIVVLPM